jgi:hypothetical protein
MARYIALGTLFAVFAAAAFSTSVGASGNWQNCGDGFPRFNYFGLKANGLTCSHAHKVANKHFSSGDKRFHGWYCKDRQHYESFLTRCHRGHKGSYQAIKYASGV